MRTREKKLTDYGIPTEDIERLKFYCKKCNSDDRLLLFQSAISSAPGLEVSVYDSLVNGLGYERISRSRIIPAKKDDFYAYQRKTLAHFYNLLRLIGKWE